MTTTGGPKGKGKAVNKGEVKEFNYTRTTPEGEQTLKVAKRRKGNTIKDILYGARAQEHSKYTSWDVNFKKNKKYLPNTCRAWILQACQGGARSRLSWLRADSSAGSRRRSRRRPIRRRGPRRCPGMPWSGRRTVPLL